MPTYLLDLLDRPGRCGGSRPRLRRLGWPAAPSPVRFSDFDSGPTLELGQQTDLRGPALRLLADVDLFVLAELLFAGSGAAMELGRWPGSSATSYGVINK